MKVGIAGCGMVGSSAAYAMTLLGVANELVLVDINHAWAKAQAEDILHATPFSEPVRVSAGDYPDLEASNIVVLSCGVATIKPVLSVEKEAALRKNAEILREAIRRLGY